MSDMDKFKEILEANAGAFEGADNPCIGLHVIYTQMVKAGFTQIQACSIIGTWMAITAANGSGETK